MKQRGAQPMGALSARKCVRGRRRVVRTRQFWSASARARTSGASTRSLSLSIACGVYLSLSLSLFGLETSARIVAVLLKKNPYRDIGSLGALYRTIRLIIVRNGIYYYKQRGTRCVHHTTHTTHADILAFLYPQLYACFMWFSPLTCRFFALFSVVF